MTFKLKEILSLCVVVFLFGTACRQSSQAQENRPVAPVKTPVEASQKCQPPPFPLVNNNPNQPIWNGASGGYLIAWTTNDLTAKPATSTGADFSIAQFALQKAIEENGAPEKWFCEHESYSKSYDLLSVVGSLASLEENDSYSPQSYVTIKYRTVNLSDATRQISLTDLFPANEVFQVLIKNPLIKSGIAERQKIVFNLTKSKAAPPANLDEFFKIFDCLPAEKSVEAKTCGGIEFNDARTNAVAVKFGASRIFVRRDLLDGFVFKKIIGGKVSVEVRLSALTGMRSEEGVPIELQMKIPASLKNDLLKADKKQAGFLMKDKSSIRKKDSDGEFLSTTVFLVGND